MEFDKHRIYTVVNADEVKLGSAGYFADNIYSLQQAVHYKNKECFGKVESIKGIDTGFRFVTDNDVCFSLFYLVAEPEECRSYYDIVADVRSRLPNSEKPMFVSECKYFKICESAKNGGCRGCSIWNYLYDIRALQEWCKEHDKDFMLFTMEMQRHLN